jgi:hypothetical protein
MKTLFFTLIVLFPALAFANVPAFPMAFWGTINLDGNSAPKGTIVRAYYGSDLAGTVTVQEDGIYGYTQSTKQKLVIKEGVGVITFSVESLHFNAGEETVGDLPITHASFVSSDTLQKELTFTSKTITTGGGGGSSSSSGGGSSSRNNGSSNLQPVEEVLGVATTTNNTIELRKQLISLLMQLVSLLQIQLLQVQSTG